MSRTSRVAGLSLSLSLGLAAGGCGKTIDDGAETLTADTTATTTATGQMSTDGTDGTGDTAETGDTSDTGQMGCPTGSNNHLNATGDCECDVGFEWCVPDDADDLNCCSGGDGDGDSGCGAFGVLCQSGSDCCSGSCESSPVGMGTCN